MRQLHIMKTHFLAIAMLLPFLSIDTSAQYGCYNDNEPPTAICDAHTVVSLTSDGKATLYATSLDDGSYDNCAIKIMKVARMTPGWCPYGVIDDTQFRPYVQFCCEDIGQPIWIIFRVIDKAGNYNECMVQVTVQDKLPPSIYCPYDKTVYCNSYYSPDEIYDPYSPVYGSATAYDNCGLEQIYLNVIGSTTCGQGHIQRVFTAIDWGGTISKCTQNVWIVDSNPFTKYDITWPWDYQASGCSYGGTDPGDLPYGYNKPRWNDTDCSLIGVAYKDLVFHFVDGVCSKILRTWTVIDWCQYDPYGYYSKGIWEYVQVIKLVDNDKPQFENCKDTTVLGLENTCAGRVVLDPMVWDICTPKDQLGYEYKVDKYNNGSIDIIRKGKPILDEVLPVGVHKVLWFVDDGCGNYSSCSFIVKVVDGKAPTPVCFAQLSTVVMPSAGMVTIWARDFNASSFDNCTAANKLRYSFSSDVYEKSRTFNCDNVGVNNLQIWVTDLSGNQAYCNTWLTIGDNQSTCAAMNPITGLVMTFSGTSIPQTSVELYKIMPDATMEMDVAQQTGSNGTYVTGFGTTNFNRMIGAERRGDPLEGISGIDLVMLQQHIVGINPITDPAALFAADVDGSGHVGVGDLLMLRDAFLSNGRTLKGKNLGWTFYPDTCAWSNDSFAPDCAKMVEIDRLNPPSEDINFIGIKKGDINGDMLTELVADRGQGYNIDLYVIEGPMGSKVQFVAAQDMDVAGLQMSLQSQLFRSDQSTHFTSGVISISAGAHYLDIDNGSMSILWLSGRNQVIDKGSTLFTLDIAHARGAKVKSAIALRGALSNRAYTLSQRPASLQLNWREEIVQTGIGIQELDESIVVPANLEIENITRNFEALEVIPNPMRDQSVIYFSAELTTKGRIEVYSADLKLVSAQKLNIVSGPNTIQLDAVDLAGPGVYYFRITGESHTSTGRFIQLD